MEAMEATPTVRWMRRVDLDDVLAIEAEHYDGEARLGEADYVRALVSPSMFCLVADGGPLGVLGAALYVVEGKQMALIRLSVAKPFQRRGVGSLLLRVVLDKLKEKGPRSLTFLVKERNVAGQLFLREHGLKCVAIVKPDDPEADAAYQFRITLTQWLQHQVDRYTAAAWEADAR